MKNKVAVVAVAVIVAAGIAIVAVPLAYLRLRGISARAAPGAPETMLARRLRHFAIPPDARGVKNPLTATPEGLHEAMEHFADHCAFCHGNDGSGRTPIAQGLYPKPPDMKLPDTQNLSDGEIYYIIQNGVRFTGMPAFGDPAVTQDDDTWKLVSFIRHLTVMTPEELAHMEQMTPKSPMEMKRDDEIQKFLEGKDD